MASFSCGPLRKMHCFIEIDQLLVNFNPKISNNWVQFIRRVTNKLFISFNLDFWKIMKLLFLLLCVLILAQSARSPSFDVRLHSSSSIPIASFDERGPFISEIETVSYGALSQILLPTPFTNYYPLRNRDFCITEDMILFYLLLIQNVLRDLLLIGVFLILFNCT